MTKLYGLIGDIVSICVFLRQVDAEKTESTLRNYVPKVVPVSPGAACHGNTVNASHVLVAMGTDPALARGAIRFSLGRETTEVELDEVVEQLKRNLK